MNLRTRTVAVTAVTTAVLVGAGGVALATGVVGPADDDDLSRPGTIAVDEATLPDDDAAEREALAELAEVDEAAAGRAAVESVGGGEVTGSELEDEDGFVVWEVTVLADDGVHHEVTVDAGTADVLGTELDDDADDADDADDDADDVDDD